MSAAVVQLLLAIGGGSSAGAGSLTGIEGADSGAFTGDVIVLGALAATDGADSAAFAYGTILSGTSPTFVISLSRILIDGYTDPLYDETSGAITAIRDQTNTGDVTDATVAGRRPSLTTSGPNSVACARFDGGSDYLTGLAISNYMTNSSKFIVLSLLPNTIDTNARMALASSTGTVQMYGINTSSTDRLRVANFDVSTSDVVTITAPEDAVYVLTLRHEGGTLYGSLNGAAESSIASGNTSVMTALLQFGSQNGSALFNYDLYECAIYGATIPDATKRGQIVANFMTHVGAV